MSAGAAPDPLMPSGMKAAVEILRDKGHAVAVRRIRNGSWRYSVDGRPETDAHTLCQRFRHYGI